MIITSKWLKDHHACDYSIREFNRVFGDRIQINPRTVNRAVGESFGVYFVAHHLVRDINPVDANRIGDACDDLDKLLPGQSIDVDGVYLLLVADWIDRDHPEPPDAT